MTLEASLNALAPPVFDGINYQVDLWEAVSEEYEVPPLFDNPTMAQIKLHNERRIMTLKTTNEIWNFLKKEYEGNERVKENNKVIVSRDVKLFESESWSWEDDKKLEFKENLEFQKDLEFQEENDNIDDELVRGTLSLSDIYQRCNVAIIEPVGYEEAAADKKMDGCNEGGA
ncbi:hypothetical protein AAG906_027936 [Vitis piasezkii]